MWLYWLYWLYRCAGACGHVGIVIFVGVTTGVGKHLSDIVIKINNNIYSTSFYLIVRYTLCLLFIQS